MESAFNITHAHSCRTADRGTKRQDRSAGKAKTSSTFALLSRAAGQLTNRPVSTAWTVVVRGTRFQINAVVSTAYLALHPLSAVGTAKDIILHPLDKVNAVFDEILRPVVATQDHETCGHYDVRRIKKRLQRLQSAQKNGDMSQMLQLVRTQLTRFVGEIDNAERTKCLVQQYTDKVCDVLKDISNACERNNILHKKRFVAKQLDLTRQSFGLSALFLSGGGTLGMTHIGVIKTLYETGCLPRIIAGSSAGAIVCAVLCTKRDQDIPDVLNSFCKGDLKVFVGDHEEQGPLARLEYFRNKGHLFDAENLRRIMKYHIGNLTFKEAYYLTGRVLNITVSSSNDFESLRLLNYATAGNIVIWSAVVASCALPFGYEAGVLMVKRRNGEIIKYDEDTLHMDGSIEGDLPFDGVSTIFNVNNYIASQVNPHVTPFLQDPQHERGRFGALCDSFLDMAKEDIVYWVYPTMLPFMADLRERAASIINQRYTGDITILPKTSWKLLCKVLSNPTPEFMENASLIGEQATLEVLTKIKVHLRIEKAIEAAMKKAIESIHFSRSARNLRKLELDRSGKIKRSGRGVKRTVISPLHQGQHAALPVAGLRHKPHFELFDHSEIQAVGRSYSPTSSSSSSRASFSLKSDEEADGKDDESNTSPSPPLPAQDPEPEVEMELKPLETLSAPNSPSRSFKALFTSPRPASPVPSLPVSLMMTSLSGDTNTPALHDKPVGNLCMQPTFSTKSISSRQDSVDPDQSRLSNELDSVGQNISVACNTAKLTRKRSLSAEARFCTPFEHGSCYEL